MGEAEKESTTAKNTVTIEDAGPCKKKVTVEIPEETVKKATDAQYETLRKDALVPGFRKGRVPRRLLEKRFGKDMAEQTKLKLLADASDAALKDNKVKSIREPDVDYEKIEIPGSGPMKFEFEVEVRPEFELPSIEAIAINKPKLAVTDEQVSGEIDNLQKWSGVWVPKEGGKVAAGDQVIADVVMKTEGVEEEEKINNMEIFARAGGFIAAVPVEKLDEVLSGAKAGDVKETSVDVPKTYFKEEYRGKKVDIKIEVKDIKSLRPAEIDESFLKRFGAESEDDLKEKMRDMLHGKLEQQVRADMSGQIYKYMLDNTKFDLPLSVVADQAMTLLQRQYTNLLRQGLGKEQLDEHMEQMRAGSEEQAKEQLKTFFIMDKVAEKLGIEVTDEEVNGHVAQMAVQRGQRPERLREDMLRDGTLAQFKLEVREEKCIAKLLETAKITEIEPEKKAHRTPKHEKSDKTEAKTDKKTAPKAEKPAKKDEKKAEVDEKTTKKSKKTTKKKTDK
ncbi:MAG: trigger factor [Planctomycetota bacterium]|nr:trigger factor [Planctomycetota bacterium]